MPYIVQLDADRTSSGASERPQINNNNNDAVGNECSFIALQLSHGLLQIAEPPLARARGQLKELM